VLARKQLRPLRESVSVVDGDADTGGERPGVLRARGEVWRIEDPLPIEVRKELEHALDFTARDALELDPLLTQRAQQLRMRVGLHRVVHAGERVERAQRARRGACDPEIVDVGGIARAERIEERLTLCTPPGCGAGGSRGGPREQLLPGGTEDLVP